MVKARELLAAAASLQSTVWASATEHQKPITAAAIESGNPFNAEFDELAKDILHQWRVPGMSIAVVDGDHVYAKGYGLATLPDTPATPDTLYYVGSTTKAQTAATLAHLIDTGAYPQLSRGWSTPISSIIRDDFVLQSEWATNHITLEDAASHRTGMARHDGSWQHMVHGRQATAKDVVRNLRNLPLSVEPRTEFHYCNLMYVVLSHVIETLTGKWLGHVIKEHIWKPLGMNATYMDLQEAIDSPSHLATSYRWREKEQSYAEMSFLPVGEVSGAGAIISNVLDFAQWLKCLIHETEPFSSAVHRDIKTPRSIMNPVPGLGVDIKVYGLGWGRTTIHGQVAYEHAGSTFTNGAWVWWLPGAKFGVVALANGAGTSNDAEEVLVRKLIEDRLRIPAANRPDLNKKLKHDAEQARRDLERADDIAFPNRPKEPLPASVEISQLAGTYFDPGYGAVTFVQQPNPDNSSETLLVAERPDFTWNQRWQLRHVSGDYWTLMVTIMGDHGWPKEFQAANFKIGVDGNVTGFEVDYYDRNEDVRQGTILFNRVE